MATADPIPARRQRRRFGRVRKLPSGRYQVRHPGSNGLLVPAPETFATKAEAARYLATVETDQLRGRWVDPRGARIRLDDWLDQWWATTTNLRPSTRERDRGYIERYIMPSLGHCELAGITQLTVRGWVADLDARDLAPATVVKAYQILGKTLSAAVDAGLLVESPCRRVPLPRIERQEMRFLNPTEVGHLADAIHPRYRSLVEVAAYGGLRMGELAGLRRDRVDVLRRLVDVSEIAVEVAGHLSFGPPKTRAGRRSVSLPAQVADRLGEHMGTWAGSEFVFSAPGGGTLRTNAWRRRFWNPAVAAAGLAPLRPHDLRHTAVALWIAQGANPKQIAARAGHASVSFTLDRYGHLFPDADEELLARLEQVVVSPDGHGPGAQGARGGHARPTPIRRQATA